MDYTNPDLGKFNLEYEFGTEYNPAKPTVIVIANARQFYVSKGRVQKIQEEIYLYGQSGGAFLITEYLSAFPDSKVKKVFIGAAVNPSAEALLGLNHDSFYREFLAGNPLAQKQLAQIFEAGYFSRELVARLFSGRISSWKSPG